MTGAMRAALGRLGRLDCLVASAGTAGKQAFTDMSLGEWHRVLQVNLDGAFLCLREAARVLVRQEQGGSRQDAVRRAAHDLLRELAWCGAWRQST